MPPSSSTRNRKRGEFDPVYDWIHIDDFTPGIITRRGYMSQADTAAGTGRFQFAKGPVGAAQSYGTYRCRASESGELIPMPGRGLTQAIVPPTLGFAAAYGPINVVGAQVFKAVSPNTYAQGGLAGITRPEELFVAFAGKDATTASRFALSRYRLEQAVPAWDTVYNVQTAGSAPSRFSGQQLPFSRINNTAPYLTTGSPVIAFVDPYANKVFAFPDPATPGLDANRQLSTDVVDFVVAHQGRIVEFNNLAFQFGAGGNFSLTNEMINYTDPANSPVMGQQQEGFYPEMPYGYGVVHSVNASELLLIKHEEGGILISGDLNNPTVTNLDNIVPTQGVGTDPVPSRVGLVYLTPFGAYTWRGGDTSEKLSSQLEDNFYLENSYTSPINDPMSPQYSIEAFEDLLLFTNNWAYDIPTGSWWKFEDNRTTAFPYQWLRKGWGTRLYAFVGQYPTDDQSHTLAQIYDTLTPANSYSWTSQPFIPTETADYYSDFRDVIIETVIDPGCTTPLITIQFYDASGNPVASGQASFTPAAVAYPQLIRANILCTSPFAYIAVTATSGDQTHPAPIIRAIHIGYQPRIKVVSQ